MSLNADPSFIDALRRRLAGEVLADEQTRQVYAADWSPYRRLPLAVARPRSREDVVTLMRIAGEHGVPLIPRAAGTSLAGQCVGEGLVVDMGVYLDAIRRIDAPARRAVVEPGVVRDRLNTRLRPHGLMFAPDPSTTAICQIGGMVGNNAWGLHALRDGTTRQHIIEAEVVLSDATVTRFAPLAPEELSARLALPGRQGEIYRDLTGIVGRHRDTILAQYPSARGIPNNAGYALDVLAGMQPWVEGGSAFNLAPLLCGAEGTLALVTEVTVHLIEVPQHRSLLCAHFATMEDALRALPATVTTRPAAVELLDRAILRMAATHREQSANRFWLQGDPGAVLLVEYSGATAEECDRHARALGDDLASSFGSIARSFLVDAQVERVWALRRGALSMLSEAEGGLQAVTGIEDSAVAVADLADYYAEVRAFLDARGLEFYVYGPVGMGVLHLRPVLPLDSPAALDKYEQVIDGVAALAARYRGSFSCKHGDGRLRGKFLPAILGEAMMEPLRAVKRAFDPRNLLNPGKILDCPPLTADIPLP